MKIKFNIFLFLIILCSVSKLYSQVTPDKYFGWSSGEIYTRSLAYNNDGTILASAGDSAKYYKDIKTPVRLWDPETGKLLKTFEGNTSWVCKLKFSPDGRLLASCSVDRSIKIWDVSSGSLVKNIIPGELIDTYPMAFTPNGKYLVYSYGNTIFLYDVKGDSIYKQITGDGGTWINCLDVSPDSKKIAAGGIALTAQDCMIDLIDIEKGEREWKWTTYSFLIYESLSFSPDGKYIASVDPFMRISLVDANTGKFVRYQTEAPRNAMCFSPDGKILATSKNKGRGTIELWKVSTGEFFKNIYFDIDYPTVIAFHPNGKKIAAGSWGKNSIRIYDISIPDKVDPFIKPEKFCLYQNYPNPFNPSTVMSFELPVSGYVTIKVYDMLGREVKSLINDNREAGKHDIQFNASNLSSGTYLYRLTVQPSDGSKAVVLNKSMQILK